MKGRLNISINDKMTTPEIGVRVIDRTCMVSRSWTYFRSVSTISRMMLFLAISWALAGCGRVSLRRLSQELLASREGDDAGGGSKASGGRWLTIAVTVLITYKATHVNKRANKEDDTTHLDQTVCRFTIPDVGNGEGFAFGYSVGDLGGADLDSEEGNGMFLFAIWVDIICVRVVL